MTLASLAVEYVRAGMALVPIPHGQKGPRTTGWNRREACITTEQHAAQLNGHNIGLAHLYSRTCCLDVDDYQLALPWLASRNVELQELLLADDAVQIRSGRPNRAKLLYRLPPDCLGLPSLKPEGSGLELRCAARDGDTTVQDVLPPSIHPDTGKPYEWAGAGNWRHLPSLPDALLTLWRELANRKPVRAAFGTATSAKSVTEGGRNVRLASLAGSMRRIGMSVETIEAALLTENSVHCQPPLSDDEVRSVAKSISKYTPADSPTDAVEIARLASLPPLAYDRERQNAADRLGIRIGVLDNEVARVRGESGAGTSDRQGKTLQLDEASPCTEPVDGAQLLDVLAETFRRHVILPEHAAEALALWTLNTYTFDAFDVCPLLILTAPEKACGKSTALSLVGRLAQRPLSTSNISPAALFRVIEAARPTLIVDEAETFTKNNDELRGILNAGHTKDAAFVLRTAGEDFEPRQFSTWAPKALAGIGRLPETLMSRSIIVTLRRKLRTESVERLRHKRGAFAALRAQCSRWTQDQHARLYEAAPVLPGSLSDRDTDNWGPLAAIADAAGGSWPQRARAAALALAGKSDSADHSINVELLGNIKAVFAKHGTDRMESMTLLSALTTLEESPWPTWNKGKPISARQLARMLNAFDIHPKVIRFDGGTSRGYAREHFEDAFARYLSLSTDEYPETQ